MCKVSFSGMGVYIHCVYTLGQKSSLTTSNVCTELRGVGEPVMKVMVSDEL